MNEKRFTYEYDEYNGNLFDNKMNTFYHIEDSDENIEVLCDRLNWLVEENEQLKKQLQKIHKLIDDNIQIYEDTTTNDDFLQIQLDTKLQTLYNLRKELFK